jgi:hypothetical protein
MGDHARREMIVRITHVVRQDPAYRPIALLMRQPPVLMLEVVRFSLERNWVST